jgi:hypothetical protein
MRIRGRDSVAVARHGAALALLAVGMLGACISVENAAKTELAIGKRCTLNSDCTDPNVCVFGRCHAECGTSADCEGGERCVKGELSGTSVCQLAIESSCATTADCPGTQVCAVDGECRDLCKTNSDCLLDQVCTQSTCADEAELGPDGSLPESEDHVGDGQPCQYNSDCPGTLLCINQLCGPECKGDKDCSPGLECVENRCVAPEGPPPECEENDDCPPGELCTAGRCAPGCVEDPDCPDGSICEAGSCAPGCNDDGDCVFGDVCDEGSCIAACTAPSDCTEDGERCNAGKCIPGCDQRSDCAVETYCGPNFECVPGCQVRADCGPDSYCAPDETCQPGCGQDSDCATGEACLGNTCALRLFAGSVDEYSRFAVSDGKLTFLVNRTELRQCDAALGCAGTMQTLTSVPPPPPTFVATPVGEPTVVTLGSRTYFSAGTLLSNGSSSVQEIYLCDGACAAPSMLPRISNKDYFATPLALETETAGGQFLGDYLYVLGSRPGNAARATYLKASAPGLEGIIAVTLGSLDVPGAKDVALDRKVAGTLDEKAYLSLPDKTLGTFVMASCKEGNCPFDAKLTLVASPNDLEYDSVNQKVYWTEVGTNALHRYDPVTMLDSVVVPSGVLRIAFDTSGATDAIFVGTAGGIHRLEMP